MDTYPNITVYPVDLPTADCAAYRVRNTDQIVLMVDRRVPDATVAHVIEYVRACTELHAGRLRALPELHLGLDAPTLRLHAPA